MRRTYRTQRLLNRAMWETDTAMAVVRRFVAERLGKPPLRVAALDETGQQKQGIQTVGVNPPVHGDADTKRPADSVPNSGWVSRMPIQAPSRRLHTSRILLASAATRNTGKPPGLR